MRQPPSPLLLSARKRRPRRNPPRGAQPGEASTPSLQQQAQDPHPPAPDDAPCALVERDGYDNSRATSSPQDDEPGPSSR